MSRLKFKNGNLHFSNETKSPFVKNFYIGEPLLFVADKEGNLSLKYGDSHEHFATFTNSGGLVFVSNTARMKPLSPHWNPIDIHALET